MPEPAALDSCLLTKLKQQSAMAKDEDAVIYSAGLCRFDLASSQTSQKVDAQLNATSLEGKTAQVFIQRTYTAPSAVSGKPVQIDEWPTRQCAVLAGP